MIFLRIRPGECSARQGKHFGGIPVQKALADPKALQRGLAATEVPVLEYESVFHVTYCVIHILLIRNFS